MIPRKCASWLLVSQGLGWGTVAVAQAPVLADKPIVADELELTQPSPVGPELSSERPSTPPSEHLLQAVASAPLRAVLSEVLERNPEVARSRRLAAAAMTRAPQVRALPDPIAALQVFVLPPETRVGPQRLTASIQQHMPWFGKLALAERAALYVAAAAEAEIETVRLDQLTEARRLAYELAFQEAHEAIVRAERSALVRYEKAAQARYAAGTGLQQEIVRIQTQITRADTLLLEISERRLTLQAKLNQLRDRPARTPIAGLDPKVLGSWSRDLRFDSDELERQAMSRRPVLAAAAARIEASSVMIEQAERDFRPDLTLGLSYTMVGRRDDKSGLLQPPEDNGDDILALTGSVNLPVRRRKLEARVAEAREQRWAAEEAKRGIVVEIAGTIGDLSARIPLLVRHLDLLESVLSKQAREALRSAETAYSTGKLNAIDLLDAEVVLFEVRIAAARTRTDLAVALAQLERAVAGPLQAVAQESLPRGAKS
ncbi:MAG: TolC family protein [Acidobacteriota bacterium]